MGNALRLFDTKTGASIRPLGKAALDVITPRLGNRPYVFNGLKDSESYYGSLPKAWKRVLTFLPENVEMPALTLHGLRHAYASVAGDLGYTEITIAALIGHSTRSTTGIYIHALDDALTASANRVANQIAEYMNNPNIQASPHS